MNNEQVEVSHFITLYCFLFIVFNAHNLAIHVLPFFFLLILFFTFLDSILENVNDVLCSPFVPNEGDTYIFYDNDNDTIEDFIYFSGVEDKTILYQKTIIISNTKSKIISPKHFVVGSHEYKLCYCSCTYNKHNNFSMKMFLVDTGEKNRSGGIQIVLIKSTFNRIHTYNWAMKIETTPLHM